MAAEGFTFNRLSQHFKRCHGQIAKYVYTNMENISNVSKHIVKITILVVSYDFDSEGGPSSNAFCNN